MIERTDGKVLNSRWSCTLHTLRCQSDNKIITKLADREWSWLWWKLSICSKLTTHIEITQLCSDVHRQSWKSNQPNHLKIHNIHFLSVPENFVSSTAGWPVWLWVFWKSHLGVLSWTMTMMPGKYGVVIIMDSDLHLASCVPAPKSYKKVWWSMKIVDRLDNVWCWCEMV